MGYSVAGSEIWNVIQWEKVSEHDFERCQQSVSSHLTQRHLLMDIISSYYLPMEKLYTCYFLILWYW